MAVETVLALFDLAGEEHIDNPLRAADLLQGEGLSPHAVADLADRVRQLHVTLARSRRRDRELSALLSSSRELAELRDLDALLHRLVERAHDLMGTDLAYLSELDPSTQELRPRSTSGAVSDALLWLRIPPGVGLAGRVAGSRMAHWTSCYERLDSVPHHPTVDAAANAEGLVAILGVPMLAGTQVLGVLFAANRSEHTFTPDEVALLSAFADHAAIVLQTARLLDQAQRAAEEREVVAAKLATELAAMERANAVRHDLTAAVVRGETVHQVAVTLAASLQRPVTVLDGQFAVVTGSDPELPWVQNDKVPDAIRAAIAESRAGGRCVLMDAADAAAAVAIVAGTAFLGGLVVGHGPADLGPVEQRTVERAAQLTALMQLRQDALIDAEERVRGELVGDVLAVDPERRRDLARRSRLHRVRLAELRTVVVVVVDTEYRQAALHALHAMTATGGVAGEHAGALAVLLPVLDSRAAAHQVRSAVAAGVSGPVLTVGAPPAPDVAELPGRFTLAERVARLVPALGTHDAAVTTDEYLPYSVLFGPDVRGLSTFVHDTIGPVVSWDAERGAELLATLRCFVQSNASPTRTARELHLHTNTVLQRLERITALLGEGWRESEALFRISIAVRMHALSAPGNP